MLKERIRKKLEGYMKELAERGQDEVRAQGHVATGKGLRSIEGFVEVATDGDMSGVIVANDYMVGPVDTGVSANRIPYSPGSGATFSLYIQGLLDWIAVVKPGLSAEEAKSFAFAIANKHKQEGMPTRGSYSFSSNGRRTDWIENGLANNAEDIERRLQLDVILSEEFARSINRAIGQ